MDVNGRLGPLGVVGLLNWMEIYPPGVHCPACEPELKRHQYYAFAGVLQKHFKSKDHRKKVAWKRKQSSEPLLLSLQLGDSNIPTGCQGEVYFLAL